MSHQFKKKKNVNHKPKSQQEYKTYPNKTSKLNWNQMDPNRRQNRATVETKIEPNSSQKRQNNRENKTNQNKNKKIDPRPVTKNGNQTESKMDAKI